MKRLMLFVVFLCLTAMLVGCGGSEQEEPEPETDDVPEMTVEGWELPDYYPEPNPMASLGLAAMDTLRAKKKRFNITRDQYWEEKGGVLANEYFEVWYPPGEKTVTHGMYVFEELMPARKVFLDYFGEAPEELLVIRSMITLEIYKELTGREWWCYSEMRGDTVSYGPLWILVRRGISSMAVPHEYYQWAIRKITLHGAPRWLEEGLASLLADEGKLLLNQVYEFKRTDVSMTPEKIEEVLQDEVDRRESRLAYYHSYRMIEKLIDTYGEDKLKEAVLLIGRGNTLDEAFMKAFNKNYQDVLAIATDYTVDLTRKKEQ